MTAFESPLLSLATAVALLLDWRTFHRTERAEHTAIAGVGPQQHFAIAAFVIELASVRWHGFLLGEATARAGQYGLKNDHAHAVLSSARRRDSPRFWSPRSGPRFGSYQSRR